MTTHRRLLSALFLLLASTIVWAQGPNNTGTYYKSANGQKGKALKTALFKIIGPHTNIGYNAIWDAYKKYDLRPDGKIWDIYSNTSNFTPGTDQAGSYKKEGDVYNREHSVPSSWFNDAKPMHDDYVHLMPTDGYVNNRRGNYPFGETNGEKYQSNNGFSKLGSCTVSGYTGIVFEPNDEYKGDLARNYFYMATAYEDKIASWSSPVMSGDSYKPFVDWQMKMLMRWSKQDTVSAKEIARNAGTYALQGNRNPFVDYPGLEDYVWGDSVNVAFSYDHYRRGSSTGGNDNPDVDQEEILLNESFAGGLGRMTVIDETKPSGLKNVWFYDSSRGFAKGSGYYNNTKYAADSRLVTPSLDLSGLSKATISVDQTVGYLNDEAASKHFTIEISTDDSETWEQLGMAVPTAFTNWAFTTYTKSLENYLGEKNVKIAFHYVSTTTTAPTWELKNLKVVGTKPSTSGINTVGREPVRKTGIRYNLSGQRVGNDYRGIVIIDGKKYFIK